MILLTEMILGGDSYEKSLGHHSGDPRGDPRGDPYVANDPAKYSLLRAL